MVSELGGNCGRSNLQPGSNGQQSGPPQRHRMRDNEDSPVTLIDDHGGPLLKQS